MPKIETELAEIRNYFARWVVEVKMASSLTYFDINKISEGTCLHLLNLVFDYKLEDLNRKKINYPGIDLGDTTKGRLAFQITSRTDNEKIKDCLQTFLAKDYLNDFPEGIRFFVINNAKSHRIKPRDLAPYTHFFDAKRHVLFPVTLIKAIEDIYYTNEIRFNEIKAFLKREFDSEQKISVIAFQSAKDKISYYRQIFAAENEISSRSLVPFECTVGNEKIATADLTDNLFQGTGVVIAGPSGCGKSILARQLGVSFLKTGLTIVLEAKYYDDNISEWLDKRIKSYGFENGASFFTLARTEQLPVLFIVDGLNEWDVSKRGRLIIELEKLKNDFEIKVLITTQINEHLDSLDLFSIEVGFPTSETKAEISAFYSGKSFNSKLDPVLKIVSTSMEARMIGEIGVEPIEKISRFTLFELFFNRKLDGSKINGFILLSKIANQLSERIAQSLPEQVVDQILRSENLSDDIYHQCISTKLLDRVLAKVSFSHEMFYNFFGAVNIARTSHDPRVIIEAINSPRNHDKKLLIIGSIADNDVLQSVLSALTDDELFLSIYHGDGGEFCRLWVERQLKDLLFKIEQEINGLEYETDEQTGWNIKFRKNSIFDWSPNQWALIVTIPTLLVKEHFVDEFFHLVRIMEDYRKLAVRGFVEAGVSIKGSFGSSTFSAAYVGLSLDQPAITRIFSHLASGIVTFRNQPEIKLETVQRLLDNKIFSYAHCYLLLLLIRYNDMLHLLYPYIEGILENHWKKVPYHLTNEILQQISRFANTNEQRLRLIEILNKIHSQTENPWFSTMIFDALESLDALDADTEEHMETVKWQIEQLFSHKEDETYRQMASGIYSAQFDHPFSSAYMYAIDSLNDEHKKNFYCMALQGSDTSMFTSALILEGYKHMKAEVAPYLTRWTQTPLFDQVFSQDAMKVFFLSHVIIGKSNFPIATKFKNEIDDTDKSLHATAEVFYWINRTNLTQEEKKEKCKAASKQLFDPGNKFAVESYWQSWSSLMHSDASNFFSESPITYIEEIFQERVVGLCRHCLTNLEFQQEVLKFTRREEIIRHAIAILENLGTILDTDVLKPLVDNVSYGTSALSAIKKLNSKH